MSADGAQVRRRGACVRDTRRCGFKMPGDISEEACGQLETACWCLMSYSENRQGLDPSGI